MLSKVYFRVDGSGKIGMGHLVRSLALAQMLKEEFYVHFVSKEIPQTFQDELRYAGIGLSLISNDEDCFQILEKQSVVVFDGYDFSETFIRRIEEDLRTVVVGIEDFVNKKPWFDYIINHAPGLNPATYPSAPNTLLSLGLDYALLRPEFLEVCKAGSLVKDPGTVLVCFGGADFNNLSTSVTRILIQFSYFKKITVVVGAAFQCRDELEKVANLDSRVEILINLSSGEMANLMSHNSLAIVPSSGVLIEAIASGCAIVSGIYVENQRKLYEEFRAQNIFYDAKNFDPDAVQYAIELAINTAGSVTRVAIDGNSDLRLRKVFNLASLEARLVIRKATLDDTEKTYSWASDPRVRKYSFSQDEIPFENHVNWFGRKLADSNCIYFIAELDSESVGSIRFDNNNGEFVISYLVDPALHGKGLGLLLLKKGVKELLSTETGAVRSITGSVMKENIGSINIFQKLGFNRTEEGGYYKFIKNV